jgi:ribA/ribD-fused uncharacterized protein
MSDFKKVTDEFVLFWHGPFSQWHPSRFTVEGIDYNCAEQFMMAEKARVFHDRTTENEILSAFDPSVQKKLGRKVQNFDAKTWDLVAQDVVYRGNVAKFTQNADLKRVLLETGERTLVEASPYDKIWGIGLSIDDPRALNPDKWLGTNWLGQVLMRVRWVLKEQQ